MACQECCGLLAQGYLLLWLLPALPKALPNAEGTPKPLPCQKTAPSVSCRGQGLPTFPRGLGQDVTQMDVSHNLITNLTDGDTAGLEQLEQLNLCSNQLQAVAGAALEPLAHLRSLLLATNRLHRHYASNSQAFLSLVRLEVLDLSGNSLDHVMAAWYLRRLPALEQLDLSWNHMTRLTGGLFWGVPKLQGVSLKNNYIMEIETGSLEVLRGLRRLDLAQNSLHCISGFALPQLQVLNLSHNALEFFETEGEAGEAYQLQALDLSHNQLAFLPQLPSSNRLRHLNLSHNALVHLAARSTRSEEVATPWPHPPRVNTVGISGHSSTTLNLAKITDLDLGNNQLSRFPVRFLRELGSLHTLSIAVNCLQDMGVELPAHCNWPAPDADQEEPVVLQGPALLSVRKLDLRGNAIRSLPHCFFEVMPHLEDLDLSLNRIHLCQAWSPSVGRGNCTAFLHVLQLKHLSLRGNGLSGLWRQLFSQTRLLSLDLSENEGLLLPAGSLEGLESSLQELSLRGNQMETSDMNFPCLGALRTLDLSENKLSSWPPSLLCSPLEKLHIRNNNLLGLEEAVAVNLSRSLRCLSVAGNPLHCCELQWLEILDAAAVTLLDKEESSCSYQDENKHFRGQISSKHRQSWPCPEDTPRGYLVAVVTSCAVCLICGTCCLLRRGAKHIPLYLGFVSNSVDPIPDLNKGRASGPNLADHVTSV